MLLFMDEMSLRIQDKMHHVRKFMGVQGRKYYSWGLTPNELECHLSLALWLALAYRDANPDDTMTEYQRFYWKAKTELSSVWRGVAKEQGRVRSNLYDESASIVAKSTELAEAAVQDNTDPQQIVEMLEILASLTDTQQAILENMSGAGEQTYSEMAQALRLSSEQAVNKQLMAVRKAILSGVPPNVGMESQILTYLGLDGKEYNRRVRSILEKARNELGIVLKRNERHNRKQSEKIMEWLKANARPQWFQANNPVAASTEPTPCAHKPPCGPALSVVAPENRQTFAIL